MVFTRYSGRTDPRAHSQTNRPECSMPTAPFWRMHKNCIFGAAVSA